MPLDPGSYNSVLVYQESDSTTTDSYGQPIKTWADVVSPVYARVRTLSGREQFYAQTTNALATVEIVCRWHPAFKPTGRFKVSDSDRYLGVVSLNDAENRRVEYSIQAIEQIPGAA